MMVIAVMAVMGVYWLVSRYAGNDTAVRKQSSVFFMRTLIEWCHLLASGEEISAERSKDVDRMDR